MHQIGSKGAESQEAPEARSKGYESHGPPKAFSKGFESPKAPEARPKGLESRMTPDSQSSPCDNKGLSAASQAQDRQLASDPPLESTTYKQVESTNLEGSSDLLREATMTGVHQEEEVMQRGSSGSEGAMLGLGDANPQPGVEPTSNKDKHTVSRSARRQGRLPDLLQGLQQGIMMPGVLPSGILPSGLPAGFLAPPSLSSMPARSNGSSHLHAIDRRRRQRAHDSLAASAAVLPFLGKAGGGTCSLDVRRSIEVPSGEKADGPHSGESGRPAEVPLAALSVLSPPFKAAKAKAAREQAVHEKAMEEEGERARCEMTALLASYADQVLIPDRHIGPES